MRSTLSLAFAAAVAATFVPFGAQAEAVKIGITKLIGYPGVPVAEAKGYFKDVGIEPELVFFDSAQPIAVAVASGDVQFGTAGMSAGFYSLAGGGQLRMIASSGGDAPASTTSPSSPRTRLMMPGSKAPRASKVIRSR